MTVVRTTTDYFGLVQQYVSQPAEDLLLLASDFGRAAVNAEVPVEDIAELHDAALKEIVRQSPQITPQHLLRANQVLVEVLMAHGLERQRLTDHYQAMAHKRATAEQTLSKRQAELEAIVEALPEALIYADRLNRIIRVNSTFSHLFGFTLDEAKQMTIDELLEVTASGVAHPNTTYEATDIIFRRKDGSYFSGSVTGHTIRTETGEAIGTIRLIRDVSAQRIIEAGLRDSESRYRLLAENISDLVTKHTMDGLFTWASPSALALIGYAPDELIGQSVFAFIHPTDLSSVRKSLQQSINQTSRVTYRFQRMSGKYIWLETVSRRLESQEDAYGSTILSVTRDITDRKKTEVNLQFALDEIQQLYFRSMCGLFRINLGGDLIDANPAMLDIIGVEDLHEMPSRQIWSFLHPESDADSFIVDLLAGPLIDQEVIIERPDGSVRQALINAYTVNDDYGRTRFIEGNLIDITEKKQVEKRLMQSEQMLQNVIDTIPVRVFWKNRSGEFLGCNPLFAQDAGKEHPSELVGLTDYDMNWAPEAHLYRADDRLVMDTGKPKLGYEEPQTSPKGDQIWLRTSKIPLRNQDGTITGLLGTYEEITEQRQTQLRLHKANTEWQYTFNAIKDFICVLDRDGQIIRANSAISQALSHLYPTIIGRDFCEVMFQCGHEEGPPECGAVLQHGKPVRFQTATAVLPGTFQISADPLFSANQGQFGAVVVLSDITDREKAVMTIRRALDEKNTLLKEIHHRVKNNLQLISSLLFMQSDRSDLSDKQLYEDSIRRIRSMSLIHERLYNTDDLARIDFGEYAQSLAVSLFRSYKTDNQIQLKLDVQPTEVNIDSAVPLGLILNELISNALKHAFTPGVDGEVSVRVRQQANTFLLSVEDSGRGLPDGFDPSSGTSMGMLLIQSLVHQLRGDITFESNTGTHITLTFGDHSHVE